MNVPCIVVPFPITDALSQSNAWRSTVVIGFKSCEYKFPCPDVAQISLSFLVLIIQDAYLHHHSRIIDDMSQFHPFQ